MFRIRGPVKPGAYRLLGHTATTRGGSRWHAGGCGQRIRLTHLCALMATFLINSWIFMLNRSSKPYVLPLPTRCKKCKGSPYSITERRVPPLIPVLGSQPGGDVSHKPGGRLPLLFVTPAVTPATLKRAATSFAAWWTEARWVWTVCLRLLPDSVAAAIWTRALLRLSPAR